MRSALALSLIAIALAAFATGCRHVETRTMEVTGYCGCGECNGYVRGSWKYLKLDFWNRYVNYGASRGEEYTGRTAGGGRLRTPRPGLFSTDSLRRPWMIPIRIVFPWLIFSRDGTIAADTDFYPFGTRMHVPGWGWGIVDDVGGAIKGSERLDLHFRTHRLCDRWGRQHVEVEIIRPN